MAASSSLRVLITGGAGFVGTHVGDRFARAGYEVANLDVREPPRRQDGLDVAKFFEGDVSRLEDVLRAVELSGAESIVHNAAVVGDDRAEEEPQTTFEVNVGGTFNALEAARSYGLRLTYISTATLYGHRERPDAVTETDLPDPVGLYDGTKYAGEILVDSYHKSFGVDGVSVRPGFVYGPGSGIGSYYLDRAFRGERIVDEPGADHHCDFTYVKDFAEGVFLAHTVRPLEHRVFNISGQQYYPRRYLAQCVAELVQGAEIRLAPGLGARAHVRGPSDISRARTELGYEPRYPLQEGLRDWLDWLQRSQESKA